MPVAMHITKVLDTKELPSFEEIKGEIARRLARKFGVDKGTESMVEKLKKEYNYQVDDEGMKELLSKGETDKTLFTLDNHSYTGLDFKSFATSFPRGLKTQVDAFVLKTVLD